MKGGVATPNLHPPYQPLLSYRIITWAPLQSCMLYALSFPSALDEMSTPKRSRMQYQKDPETKRDTKLHGTKQLVSSQTHIYFVIGSGDEASCPFFKIIRSANAICTEANQSLCMLKSKETSR